VLLPDPPTLLLLVLGALNYLVVGGLIAWIVFQRRDTRATWAWIFFLVLVPSLGLLVFWVVGFASLRHRRWRRKRADSPIGDRLEPLVRGAPLDPTGFPADPGLHRLACRLDGMAAQPGNSVTLYREGRVLFDDLEAAIDEATHHVHLVYYLWEPDSTGQRIRAALMRAAQRGVEVRLLIDDVGCFATPAVFFRPLQSAGGRVARFLPLSLFARGLGLNHRNHRKIVIVDGAMGFAGGMNVGDTYAGVGAPWQDAHARVAGPAVQRLQEIFAQDWFQTTEEDLAQPEFFPAIPAQGEEWVQFVASGPAEERWTSIHTVLFTAITQSKERVWLETPYFVPDPAMALALEAAALRGVDVRLLLPGHSDHRVVLYAGRFYYPSLVAAGVRIYEVPRVFLHAKTVTIDTLVASVGSANLDQRSFRLNFEANAFFYGPALAGALERSFEATQREATPVTEDTLRQRSRRRRALEALARLLGPVL
jgi:cardiolipin synthase